MQGGPASYKAIQVCKLAYVNKLIAYHKTRVDYYYMHAGGDVLSTINLSANAWATVVATMATLKVSWRGKQLTSGFEYGMLGEQLK